MSRFRRWFVREYLTIDARTLALTRVALAALLLLDLGKRAAEFGTWYGTGGLLPLDAVLAAPTRRWSASLFFYAHSDAATWLGFALCFAVYAGLLVGWRTRWMQAASIVAVVSLHARVDLLENGGDFVLCIVTWWTAFLPLGRQWSLDARRGRERPDEPVVSLAVLAALVQLAVIYWFNGIHKRGPTWRNGTAVYYLLQQERIIGSIGLWARHHLPFGVMWALSWGALVIEHALPILILSPIGKPWTRRIAVVLVFALHGGIQTFANFGMFSPAMCVFGTLLVDGGVWDRLGWGRPAAMAPAPRGVAVRSIAREVGVACLIVIATAQMLVENPAVPPRLRPALPTWLQAAVSYTRLQQGWRMFAPDAPTSEMSIVIDAVTADGRHVDPLNAVAARAADPLARRVPERPGYDVYWVDYVMRIPEQRRLERVLRQWLLDYGARTGRPEDRIVAFTAWRVEQDSPPPGHDEPPVPRARVFLRDQLPEPGANRNAPDSRAAQ